MAEARSSSALPRSGSFGPLLVVPAAILLVGLLAYPLGLGVWLGFKDAKIGAPGTFIGVENYRYLLDDPVFRLTVVNTALYTIVTVILKLGLGLGLALVLNQKFAGVRFWRSVLLLPYVVPTVLSAFAWWWIFDPQFSFISWALVRLGLLQRNIDFLGHLHPHRLPARLDHHPRRTGQRDAPLRDARLPARHPRRGDGRGRGHRRLHAAVPRHPRLRGAAGDPGARMNGRFLKTWLPLALFAIFLLFPFYWMVLTALRPNAELVST